VGEFFSGKVPSISPVFGKPNTQFDKRQTGLDNAIQDFVLDFEQLANT